jgi:hypothetical protein
VESSVNFLGSRHIVYVAIKYHQNIMFLQILTIFIQLDYIVYFNKKD